MKKTILTAVLAISSIIVFAQGQPSAKIFSNFNYDLSAEEGESALKAFEVKKAYLGYSHQIADDFTATVTFDVGKNDGGSAYTAFLKIAALNWKASDNLSVNFGMIGTKNFKFMENAWGKRYIYKSFQDQHKWTNAADAGVSMDYSISDNLSIDAQILNGEGYKKTQSADGLMRGGVGITYAMNKLKFRVSRDIMPRSSYTDADASQNISTIAMGYSSGNLSVGGEYNMRENTANVVDNTATGMSFYGSMQVNQTYSVFGRYDDATSENAAGERWNINNEGNLMIFGVERKMANGVKVAINMQSWTDATAEGAEEVEAQNTLFLNLGYKF